MDPTPERINVTRAKREYRLTENDLENLDCVRCANPFVRTAVPMRLYLLEDVVAVAEMKRLEREHRFVPSPAVKRAEARARAAEARAHADKVIAEYVRIASRPGTNGCAVPIDVLATIANKLADSFEPGGIRGPEIVVTDLCNAAAALPEMRVGFARIAAQLAYFDVPGVDAFLQNPRAASKRTDRQAKDAARIITEYGALPPWVPNAVMNAVVAERTHCERSNIAWTFAWAKESYPGRGRLEGIVFRHYKGRVRFDDDHANVIMLMAAEQPDMASLRQVLAARWPTIEALLKEPARNVLKHPPPTPMHSRLPRASECRCGNAPARGCEKGCCRACCTLRPGVCTRHHIF